MLNQEHWSSSNLLFCDCKRLWFRLVLNAYGTLRFELADIIAGVLCALVASFCFRKDWVPLDVCLVLEKNPVPGIGIFHRLVESLSLHFETTPYAATHVQTNWCNPSSKYCARGLCIGKIAFPFRENRARKMAAPMPTMLRQLPLDQNKTKLFTNIASQSLRYKNAVD